MARTHKLSHKRVTVNEVTANEILKYLAAQFEDAVKRGDAAKTEIDKIVRCIRLWSQSLFTIRQNQRHELLNLSQPNTSLPTRTQKLSKFSVWNDPLKNNGVDFEKVK